MALLPWLSLKCPLYLGYSLSLGDKLISDLDSGVAQTLEHVSRVQAQQVSDLVSIY